MAVLSQDAVRNRLLRALSPAGFSALLPHLEPVDLPLRRSLVEADVPISHVHFLEGGLASVLATCGRKHRQIEVAHIGREGLTGADVLQGADRSPNQTFMQVAGSALRISVESLLAAVDADRPMASLFQRYINTYEQQLSQTALANGHFNMHARLARWLLMCHDRLDGDDIPLTHEFLALMLGVRRSGVTITMHILEGMGAIKSTRARLIIRDRSKLEQIAAGCYGVPERAYERLIGSP